MSGIDAERATRRALVEAGSPSVPGCVQPFHDKTLEIKGGHATRAQQDLVPFHLEGARQFERAQPVALHPGLSQKEIINGVSAAVLD